MGRAQLGAPAAAAALFTRNQMAAAPVRLSQEHLLATDPAGRGRRGWASAVISTSGSANAATGAAGDADQAAIAAALAAALEIEPRHTLTLSTGVIGARLPVARVTDGLDRLLPALGDGPTRCSPRPTRWTTDSVPKAATTTSFELAAADGSPVTVRVRAWPRAWA
jgi:glutamate N-acetyltransferase/amino-acid N-acetyltransferase